MPKWPEKRQLIGTSVPRVDGLLKVSGKAKYSYDINLPGLLYGKILRSPLPRAKIVSLDLSAAESMPGVKAVHEIKKAGDTVHYTGDEIAAVAATTEGLALDAIRAIQVKYEKLDHVGSEEDGLEKGSPAVKRGQLDERGENVDEVLKGAAATIEATYGCNVVTHACLETHGLVAQWEGDKLTVWCRTQGVHMTKDGLQGHFKKPVTCITKFMGGGFGSSFGPNAEGIAAAELARKAGAPVKLMLDRAEEHRAVGNRPSAFAKVRVGCDKEGKLLALDAETWGTGGHSGGAGFPLPYIYIFPNRQRIHTDVFVNAGNQRPMRAPGHPQGCYIEESIMDDLCHQLDPNMDPMEFRIRNLPDRGPQGSVTPIWIRQLRLGAARIGWRERWHPRGDTTKGPWKRGLGCAIGRWAGGPGGAEASVMITPDGRVEVKIGTQDLGTGTTTLVPLVAAEILGLRVDQIDGLIGSSDYPPAGPSGGSTTVGGVSLAVGVASMKALRGLFNIVAPELGVQPEDLEAEAERVYVKGNREKGFTWRQACARIGPGKTISANANKDEGEGMASSNVGGAQFADVSVDTETGIIRLNKIVAVADCGMVVNRLTCESQVYGAIIMGVTYALFEERRLDRRLGIVLNPDMENYKLACVGDLPEIEVHLLDYPERGVIGIGEPPTIPTAGAISNAVANAIGVRVPVIPLTPSRVLAALEKTRKV